MIALKQPNRWSCLVTSFAMCLEVQVAALTKIIGHDGSQIIRPELEDPYSRRGFHIQELIDCCFFYEVKCVEIQPRPAMMDFEVPMNPKRIYNYLGRHNGIIVGSVGGQKHAAGWYNQKVYDPSVPSKFEDWAISSFFILDVD